MVKNIVNNKFYNIITYFREERGGDIMNRNTNIPPAGQSLNPEMFKSKGKNILMIVLVAFFVMMLIRNVYTIKTGEVGIVTRFGKVVRQAMEGINVKIPFIENVTKIEIRDNTIGGQYEVSSEDMQTVKTDISVQYKINDPLNIFKRFRNQYKERLLEPRIAEVVQAATSAYTIEELVSKRQELSQKIYTTLREDLKEFGVQVVKISITNHDFSDEYEKAIEAKKAAEQEAQKVEIENNQKIKTAEANLKVKELEARANSVLTQSLTREVLQKQWIEKWDGKLPQYQGGNANPILNMNEGQ